MNVAIVIIAAYLMGSIPFALLLSRRHGIDLRDVGSGNVGATNLLRTIGVRVAVVAMLLDAAKGTAAVLIAQRLASGITVPVAAALASMLGHVYPIWLRFRGGKGVATAAGAFGVLTPLGLGGAATVFLLVVWVTRFVSVGSMIGAVTLAGIALASDAPIIVGGGAAVAAIFIIYGHRANLARLTKGTERRVGQRVVGEPVD
ncbi:MAG TPA: glycerol-3-phosphate 1-O-acyltransferase PlsY [Vicinamibacterales bacterium]|nr:glycerol-3-phosphate 1-O-acyltransferase PlsY [Vicinamibacterales bacterium]